MSARRYSHAHALFTVADRHHYVACAMLKNGKSFEPCFEARMALKTGVQHGNETDRGPKMLGIGRDREHGIAEALPVGFP